MKRLFIFIFSVLLFISFVNASWSENTFNNSLTEENLTFNANENITRWLEVPEDTIVTNGFLNLSGFINESLNFVINNTITSSFSTSITTNGTDYWVLSTVTDSIYHYDNSFSIISSWSIPGDFNNGIQYYNDNIYATVQNNDIYKFSKTGVSIQNFTLIDATSTSNILDNGTNFLVSDTSSDNIYVYDYNFNLISSTPFTQSLNTYSSHTDKYYRAEYPNLIEYHKNFTQSKIYDISANTAELDIGVSSFGKNIYTTYGDQVNTYTINTLPLNPSLSINNTEFWNFTGYFDQINNKTLNIASYINNYILSSIPVFGNFLIPFVFNSDSVGILQYLDLIFNDDGFFEYSITYDSNITEGETNIISTKIAISDDKSITGAILAYNGINYTTSIFYDGDNYTIISNNPAPIILSDTNYSLKFIISIDGVDFEGTTNNQTVLNLNFGICGGVSNDTLLNMSLFDEETFVDLMGDIEFNADITSKSSGEIIESISGTFSGVHSGAICFSPTSSYNLYNIDTEIRYFTDGYATEFYHIQNADIGDYPINLSLFDLNQNDSTEFSVTYKNDAFIFTEGAIIQLQRKYIGEDIYEVVEAPITGDGGKSILHIDLNNVKYRASVVKDGELLDFFDDIVFSCENELSGECTHSLDGTVSPNNDVPLETITDFSYSVSIDEDNQTVTVLFAVPSGTPSSINVLLNQIDTFGNLTSCNTTVITSAGSITCDYTDSIEANILELSISKDGVQLVILNYANNPELDMDGINFFIIFLFMISLVGMAISSPEWMLIISAMVLMIGGTLLLVSGMNLVIGLGAIGWLIVAIGIIIFKMAKQEDR